MGSKKESGLERCFEVLAIYLTIIKAWKEFVKRWWVNPYD